MKFNFSAEWPLSKADIDWLQKSYFPQKLAEAIQQIREIRALDGHAFNPDSSGAMVQGVEVNILLKAGNWTNASAVNGAAGQTWVTGISGNSTVADIWINWAREMDPANNLYGRVVRHELIHFLLWLQYPPADGDFVRYENEWQNSQHGRLAPDKDVFLITLNKKILDYYPSNHSSNPGTLPTPVA